MAVLPRMRDDDRFRDLELESIESGEEERQGSGLTQPFDEVIDQHDHLEVTGAAGLGKTALGQHLVSGLSESLLEPGRPNLLSGPYVLLIIPARVLARHMRGSRSVTRYTLPSPASMGCSPEEKYRQPYSRVSSGYAMASHC